MFFAAWRTKRFALQGANVRVYVVHLLAGIFMGMGAALALGGNDTQLLVFLPSMSLASVVTMMSMFAGIRIGLAFNRAI